jgi:hypothetical protein
MQRQESITVTFGDGEDRSKDLDVDLYGEDEDSVTEQCKAHFGDKPYEIVNIDPDLPDGGFRPKLEDLIEIQEMADRRRLSPAVFLAYFHNCGSLGRADEAFQGEYQDAATFAREYTEGIQDVPDWLENYVDWKKMGEDFLSSDFFEVGGYYFRNL